MKFKNQEQAELCSSEALINCWIREGGNLADLQLSLDIGDRSLVGDLRLAGPVRQHGKVLSSLDLASIITERIRQKENCQILADWHENLISSIDVMRFLFGLRHMAQTPSRATSSYIDSEQSFLHGHRFHPSPKSRIGFSETDLSRYSPEHGQVFPLHYMAIDTELARVDAEPKFWQNWRSWSEQNIAADSGSNRFTLLPMHPWQAQKMLSHAAVQRGIQLGLMQDLGIKGPCFAATSSVRTLYQSDADFFIKTSLDVRITNCFRRNTPHDLRASRATQRMLDHPDLADLRTKIFRDRFTVLREPAAIDIEWSPILDGQEQIQNPPCLGVLFREGLGHLAPGKPLLAATLFGDRELSVTRMTQLLEQSELNVRDWLAVYAQALVLPIITSFAHYGLMFEPHLQNILVVIDAAGKPKQILQRDLENVRLTPTALAWQAIHPQDKNLHEHLTLGEEDAWRRLVYCLVVNHLSETVFTLSRASASKSSSSTAKLEQHLWQVLSEVIGDEFQHTVSPSINAYLSRLLFEESLFVKKNMHTRITHSPDRQASFALLANPLMKNIN